LKGVENIPSSWDSVVLDREYRHYTKE